VSHAGLGGAPPQIWVPKAGRVWHQEFQAECELRVESSLGFIVQGLEKQDGRASILGVDQHLDCASQELLTQHPHQPIAPPVLRTLAVVPCLPSQEEGVCISSPSDTGLPGAVWQKAGSFVF
jgi:hypothetical protein